MKHVLAGIRSGSLRNVPVSIRIFLAPGLTLCALLVVALVATIGLRGGARHVRALSEGAFDTFRLTVEARNAASDVQLRLLDAILVSATEADKDRFLPRMVAVQQASAQARQRFGALADWVGDRTPVGSGLRSRLNAYLASVDEVLHIARTDPASAWIIVNEVRRAFAQVDGELARLQANTSALRNSVSREAIGATNLAISTFLLVTLLTVGFSIVVTLLAARSITQPIARLTRAMSDLAGGNLGVTVPDNDRRDEIGAMAAAMQVFKDGLTEAGRLSAEQETARIQELQRVRQLADAAFEGIVIHRGGRVLAVNVALCELLGYPDAASLRGARVLRSVTPESRARLRDGWRALSADVLELEILRADGSALSVEVLSRPFRYGQDEAVLTAVRDLSERKRAEAQIRKLAFHDALTGLPNRYALHDCLSRALETAERNRVHAAVLCLDLDRFKNVNDVFGHDCGDELLQQVAMRLQATVRASDTVARLGGDEFAIVQIVEQVPHQVAPIAQRLVECVSAPYEVNGRHIDIGVSIGIAVYPEDGSSGNTLMKHADIALYRAKAAGREQYKFFEAAMDAQLHERNRLEQDLRQAFARRELALHYQPIFTCSDRALAGFEALLRWTHPVRGVVSPEEFVPAAEECGLIQALGYWVLETACAEAVSWQQPWTIAVNVSPVQFRDAGFPDALARVLMRTGLAAERIELEITEGVLMADPEEALATLRRLRSFGVRISLDDFGTGYSSLSYLRRFPFDKLKIDKSFVAESETNPEAAAIVAAIVSLGHSLHLQVIGEGVETEAQIDLLSRLGCHQVQGYLLGRPQRAEAIDHAFGQGVRATDARGAGTAAPDKRRALPALIAELVA